MGTTCVSVNPAMLRNRQIYKPAERPMPVIRHTTESSLRNSTRAAPKEPSRLSFMREHDYLRTHVESDPDAFVQSMRVILSALG